MNSKIDSHFVVIIEHDIFPFTYLDLKERKKIQRFSPQNQRANLSAEGMKVELVSNTNST